MLPLALTLAFADVPPPPDAPGPATAPCTVETHASPGVACVACRADHGAPDACLAAHGAPGWRRACRGGGASVWTEVWCPDATTPDAACPNAELEARAMLGRLSAAERACVERRATEGPEDDRRAASTLLVWNAAAGDPADQRRVYERHVALDPGDAQVGLWLAKLLLDRGEAEAARDRADRVIDHLAQVPAGARRLPAALRLRALASVAIHEDAVHAGAPSDRRDATRARARADLEAWRAAAKVDDHPDIDARIAALTAPLPVVPTPGPAEPPAPTAPGTGCGCAAAPSPPVAWLALLGGGWVARRRRRRSARA